MNISVVIEGSQLAAPGIDPIAVVEDIEAEVTKLATKINVTPDRTEKAAPTGAQGEFELIEWVVKIAQEPSMAKFYIKALIFAINQILEACRSNQKANQNDEDTSEDQLGGKPLVRIKVLGRSLSLPAATLVIQEFLKSLGDE